MSIEKKIRILAGSMTLLGLGLGVFANRLFLWLPAFVGLNLLQSSFTGFCPAEGVFRRLAARGAPAPEDQSCCGKAS